MIEFGYDPENFLENAARQRGYRKPVLELLTVGLFFLADFAVVYQQLGAAEFTHGALTIVIASFYGFFPLALWVAFGLTAYALIKMMGEHCRLGNLYRVTSYGFLPLGLSGLFWTVGRWLTLDPVPSGECESFGFNCSVMSSPPIDRKLDAVLGFRSMVTDDPVFIALFLVGLLFLIPASYLWWVGISKASTLSRRKALGVTAINSIGVTVVLFFTVF